MTLRRLLLTTAAMAGAALGLDAVTPALGPAVETVLAAPRATTPSAAEQVVLAATGLLAWLAWAWGALGLTLTAASGLPGAWGAVARVTSRVVLPAGLRSAAGVALGVGLVVAAPAASAVGIPAEPSATGSVPDWPRSGTGDAGPPDWPTSAAPSRADVHVVVAGDCLWDIAADRLRAAGSDASVAAVARAVPSWWETNADVIGADPDLIHPGQVLRPPPDSPTDPTDDRSGSTR